MGLTQSIKPFGHGESAAVDIEGLALLEDHLKQLRAEDGVEDGMFEEDDEGAWEGWDVESDSDEESSDGWMDVESDGEDLDISDSDDEGDSKKKSKKGKGVGKDDDGDVDMDKEGEKEESAVDALSRISTLATTKIHFRSVRLAFGLILTVLRLDSYAGRFRASERPQA